MASLERGLYQLPDAPIEANHTLAEASRRLAKGTVCLTSALAFHELTDQLPLKVWMAIGQRDWAPKAPDVPIRVVRFADHLLNRGAKTHKIEEVSVRVFEVAKTIADCFRYRRRIGLSVAIQGLREALRQRKSTPAEIAREAEHGGVTTVIRPYLETLTAEA